MILFSLWSCATEVAAAVPTCHAASAPDIAGTEVALRPVLEDCGLVTDLQFVTDDQLIVTTKDGNLVLADLAAKTSRVVMSVPVKTSSELGLLGVALHPKFSTSHRLVVSYNPRAGGTRSVVELWRWDDFPAGKPVTERKLLEFDQPYDNHDGGQVQFGPDGFLYAGFGDGGSRDDPHGNGQNLQTFLGKILRIDVDGAAPYAIPPDNPFAKGGGLPEIFAYGLRNPWRFSFLPDGRLVAADVGQDTWEEIDLVPKGGNMGWNTKEARHCFPPGAACTSRGLVEPIWEYDRTEGVSVTGGYHAASPPAIADRWIFGDYGSGWIWALRPEPLDVKRLGKFPGGISTFGRDRSGRVYVGNLSEGRVYRIVEKPAR